MSFFNQDLSTNVTNNKFCNNMFQTVMYLIKILVVEFKNFKIYELDV